MKHFCAAALLCCLISSPAAAQTPAEAVPDPAGGVLTEETPAEQVLSQTAEISPEAADAAAEESPMTAAGSTEGADAEADTSAPDVYEESDAYMEEAPSASAEKRSHPVEVQFEYIEHRFYNQRSIDNYSIHMYQEMKANGTMSFWRGLTLTRPTGSVLHPDAPSDSSDSWGIGPSFMIRWDKPVSEKWSLGIDGTGSLLVYNHAFPAGGRAFGFMWRIGPRLSYHPNKDSAIRLGWSYMHASNGFSSHNPGYNGVGFSLMYAHNF